MKSRIKPNYTKGLVICHGLSEFIFVDNLKQNLRLPIEIYAKKSGRNNIQITSLLEVLNNMIFKTKTNFLNKFTKIETKGKNKIVNFKMFTIMDLDDCDQKNIVTYKNNSMFRKHWLAEYIIPIYNHPNLDSVMIDFGYNIDSKNKVRCYRKFFPGENGNIEEFMKIKDKFENYSTKKSNIICLLNYLYNCIKY